MSVLFGMGMAVSVSTTVRAQDQWADCSSKVERFVSLLDSYDMHLRAFNQEACTDGRCEYRLYRGKEPTPIANLKFEKLVEICWHKDRSKTNAIKSDFCQIDSRQNCCGKFKGIYTALRFNHVDKTPIVGPRNGAEPEHSLVVTLIEPTENSQSPATACFDNYFNGDAPLFDIDEFEWSTPARGVLHITEFRDRRAASNENKVVKTIER